ncbi:MAG: PGN_0703 family putative restriction endonuclease, partial [Candidatus Limisoma sp.]
MKNHELCELKDFLSYSSVNPKCRYFVKTDNAFTRKARLLQAIHRKESGSPCGSITKRGITYYHPNLATNGSDTGCNFLSQEIFEYAKWRIEQKKAYETINEDRLFNNFLSSQPMAFNLFVPLMSIVHTDEGKSKLAKVVAEHIINSDSSAFNKITEVGIEFIPPYYSECLNDKTAMDAYFMYERTDGKHGLIAIETKYTDILGTNPASNPSFAIRQATENIGISQLLTNEGIEGITKRDIKLSQVYRNFLLTETVRLHEHLDDSISIILSPKGNMSNEEDERSLIAILKDEYKYKFQSVTLESFVSSLIREFPDTDLFRRFENRYLDFERVEKLIHNSAIIPRNISEAWRL